MTNAALAEYSNLAMYSAMGVLTLAMIGYSLYLAGLVPDRAEAKAEALDRETAMVGAGAPTDSAPTRVAGLEEPAEVSPRARQAASIAGTLTWLGALLLILTVALRGLSVGRAPLGNMFEFATMACMFTTVAFSIWSTRRDLRWLGVFVIGPVLLVLGLALVVWYTEAAQLMPSLQSYWLVIHVTVATLSVALMTIGAAASTVYLIKDRFEQSGRPSFLDRFPESRAVERTAYRIHIIGFPLWTFTVIAGAIWAREAWGSYWNWDPKEVWTFVIWVVYAAYLHARATSGWRRQSANWIALAGYGCILVNYAVVNVYFVGQHSYSGL